MTHLSVLPQFQRSAQLKMFPKSQTSPKPKPNVTQTRRSRLPSYNTQSKQGCSTRVKPLCRAESDWNTFRTRTKTFQSEVTASSPSCGLLCYRKLTTTNGSHCSARLAGHYVQAHTQPRLGIIPLLTQMGAAVQLKVARKVCVLTAVSLCVICVTCCLRASAPRYTIISRPSSARAAVCNSSRGS